MRSYRPAAALVALAAALAGAGCRGEQSVLAPRGPEAEGIATLALVLFAGGTFVLLVVVVLTGLAIARSPERRRWLGSERLVIWGGLVFPSVVLTATLVYGLTLTDGGFDEWQRLYLFSRADTIYGGSNEIQRNIVAQHILGL